MFFRYNYSLFNGPDLKPLSFINSLLNGADFGVVSFAVRLLNGLHLININFKINNKVVWTINPNLHPKSFRKEVEI